MPSLIRCVQLQLFTSMGEVQASISQPSEAEAKWLVQPEGEPPGRLKGLLRDTPSGSGVGAKLVYEAGQIWECYLRPTPTSWISSVQRWAQSPS